MSTEHRLQIAYSLENLFPFPLRFASQSLLWLLMQFPLLLHQSQKVQTIDRALVWNDDRIYHLNHISKFLSEP